ncbi:hypothetical protein CAOG_09059, partial [Capsaspora owczarzaki ATCC 30864]|uniref:hypothetical protein n=1 Tax=Capsaspora owczarzaki (strain ATCC 30864) TaxID=595528 RepID=UPI0003525EB0
MSSPRRPLARSFNDLATRTGNAIFDFMRGQQSGLVLVRSRRPPPRGLLLPSRPLAQVLVVLLLGLWVWPSSAAEFYVAPAGDDAGNTGTSPTSPFRTVSKAMSTANSGDSIYLANGVYSGPGNIGVLVADVHVSLIGESQEGTIFDCMGASGPVFDVSFGTPLFANLTIQHCFSMSSSGAMTISGITVSASLVNVTIRYCSSNSVGGAIQVQLANATFDNVRLENNAAVNGGSLFIVSSPHIHVRNMFDFNSTAINGAAIYATATSIDIHDSVFALSAASSLGVVYLALSKCEVTTSRFEGTAGTSIFTSQAQLLIDDCVFSGNTNQLSGSAVQITATDTNDGSFDRILNSLFVDNTAYDRGALYVKNGGYAVVQNCTFLRNRSFSGGAVSVTTDGTAFLYNCTLQDNSATSAVSNATISSIIMDGGGALEASKSGAFLSADNCIMVNNTSQYGGAVFAGSKGTVIINGSNTVIANNTAWFMGGGLYVQDSATIIVANSFNVSVEQNVAVFGGGFAIGSKGTLMLSNVIARGNMAALAGSGGYVSGTFVPSHVYYDGNVAGKLSGGVVLFSDPASAKVCDTCVVLPNNLEIFDGGSVRTSRITTGPSVIFMRSYSDTFSFAPGGNGTAVNPYVSTIRIVPGTFLGISLEVHDAFGSTLEGVGPEYRITADFLPAGVGAFRFYIPGPLSGGKFAGALPFIGQFNTTFTLFIRLTYVDSHLVPNVGPLVLEFSTADSCGPDQVEQKVAISNMASLPNCVATELSTVASSAFISIQAVTSLFALFTIVVFLLIRGFRSHRAIRAASPTLLQLMLAATSLVFVAIFLMGVDTESDE